MAGAFQSSAFQPNAWQISAVALVTGGWAPEKKRRAKQREFELDNLRETIEAAVSPVEGPAEVVQEPRQVTVRPAAGPAVSIPVPPAFDAAEVARMVSAALGRAVQAAEEVAAQARAAETVRLELERLRRRRRQDEELLLLM